MSSQIKGQTKQMLPLSEIAMISKHSPVHPLEQKQVSSKSFDCGQLSSHPASECCSHDARRESKETLLYHCFTSQPLTMTRALLESAFSATWINCSTELSFISKHGGDELWGLEPTYQEESTSLESSCQSTLAGANQP
jgi:hypothetical protein